MAAFSWSDTARAVVASCLPCLPSSRPRQHDDREHLARRDELESLLQGAEFTDTDIDVDAMSLHSQLGRQDGRKRVKTKRTKHRASITLFGLDLFGRSLPDSGDVDGDDSETRRKISRISSSTLDSDAAPLADEAIAELSAQSQAQRQAEMNRKAARKRQRKQQKAAALIHAPTDEFEGFQGSGTLAPAGDDFGAFQQAGSEGPEQEFIQVKGGGADEDDVDADFDASAYVRTAAPRSDSGSGTRSRTSASNTQAQPLPALPSSSSSPSPRSPTSPTKRKRSKKSGKRSATTASSGTASQPRSPTSTEPTPHVDIAIPNEGLPLGDPPRPLKRELRLTGESVHGDQERAFPIPGSSSSRGFPSPGLHGFPSPGLGRSGGFPSPGLGGRKNSLSLSGQGAFLARTGEDP